MREPQDGDLLALIDKIYTAALDPAEWSVFLEHLARLLAGGCGIISQSTHASAVNAWDRQHLITEFVDSYEAYYHSKKPWIPKLHLLRADEVFGLDWLIDEPTYQRSEYLNDWIKPQGMYYLVGGCIDKEGSVGTILSMMRPREADDFSTAHRKLIHQLLPHLRRGLQVHRQVSVGHGARDALLAGFEALQVGLIVSESDGRITFANSVAERFIADGDALRARSALLQARRPSDTNRLLALIGRAAATGVRQGRDTGGMISLPSAGGGCLSVLVSPFPAQRYEVLGATRARALLFLTDPASEPASRERDLVTLYGLTPAEAALLAALLNGRTLQRYADETGISMNTAKTHLRHIFEKTGRSRQADLIREVLMNPLLRMAAT
ncbi:MAG TPA: LuxR C-terminal-related transcriptional regulator [Stellaceae bacterium]|nr:LuxR C-terminal-related transcriptional regulator [Stellaceae bacterium]